ncbi:unnamed protein product [Prorocentrum cordatum]|uniref:Uncharacterized protein n=1 Tax=Prorocentrum cordatum TaxID=2364126 RepID=A0ABN9Y5F0_9DINO|nr:unnamed protein product [Polarella glacialis]
MAVAAAPAACGDGLAKAAPPRQPGPRGRSAAPTAEVRSRLQLDGYGRVPHFLEEIVGVLEDELAYVEGLASGDSEEDLADRPQVRLLTDAERSCLLEGLDAKRSHLMRCFEEDLDLHPEEEWRQRVREQYSPEIRQLDKDVAQMSQRYVFVATDG